MLALDRTEIALSGSEYYRYDIHPHLINETCRKHLPAYIARSNFDDATTGELLRLRHRCLDPVDEVKWSVRIPAIWSATMGYHNHVVHPTGRSPTPALSQIKDRKSTRLNSSHVAISYAVFCLKKKI